MEYGTVHRLTVPGSLSVPLRWTDGPTQLDFVLDGRTMAIVQDGDELASVIPDASLTSGINAGLKAGEVTWGRGIFGDFGGVTLDGRVEGS